jgi:hypothetical protein
MGFPTIGSWNCNKYINIKILNLSITPILNMYSNCTKLWKNLVETKYDFMFPSEKKTQNF